jgi:hypothetical protein
MIMLREFDLVAGLLVMVDGKKLDFAAGLLVMIDGEGI